MICERQVLTGLREERQKYTFPVPGEGKAIVFAPLYKYFKVRATDYSQLKSITIVMIVGNNP